MIVGRGRTPTKGTMILAAIIAAIGAAIMVGSGIFLLVQRQTGPRATATVAECVHRGGGRYGSTHCTGSWIVGGSLLEGGHVVVGTIDGAVTDDVGKTIDVTLRGDTAYTRGLALPFLLIGLGIVPAALVALLVRARVRAQGKNPPTLR